ncbi:LamG-like jellyroll fold domain-containing protein [Winogradskyella poriferorum]|uniref:LamG-like jellyroll fold domain-containing protein n=1 Tax=Winogradskyella poriferorum TaxID=307627 RepID=A0ABU7W3A4_9FLAO
MKTAKNQLVWLLSLFCALTFLKLNAQYCTPVNINNYNTNYISNVSIGTINKSSGGPTGSYNYYSNVSPTDITAGETLTGTVKVKIDGWNTNVNTVVIWLNFNEEDDDFEDSGERFLFTFQDTNSTGGKKNITVPISIPIPSNVQNGLARMRVGMRTGSGTSFTSCDYGWEAGEVEDYDVNFVGGGGSSTETAPLFCEPANINNYNTLYISNVSLAGIDNSSSGSTGSYTYYSGIAASDIPTGETLTGSINVTLNGWNTNVNTVAVWLNFNESSDNDYEDAGERFLFTFQDTNNVGGNKTVTVPISIPVPNTADEVLSKMRVAVRGGSDTNFTSCDFQWVNGEVEDYLINFGSSSSSSDPDIALFGNNNSISNGDTSTIDSNFTDFGTYDVYSGAIQRVFEITNEGESDLTLTTPYVSISGSSDFSIISQPSQVVLANGESTSFVIEFDPSSTTVVFAEVSVQSNDPDENPFTFTIKGEGRNTFPDTDGDGVPNIVDLDDDNDGVLDSVESSLCNANPLSTTTDVMFLNETFGAGIDRVEINGNYFGVTTSYCYEDGTGSCSSSYNSTSVNDGDYTVHHTITNNNNVNDGIDVDIASWAEDYWYAGEDHTPGDTNGRMAIFNATEEPGVFYSQSIVGATPNVPVQFGFYAINIDRDDAPDVTSRIRPEVVITIYDPNGNVITSETSGLIEPTSPAGDWVEVSASFTTTYSEFTVELSNANLGGIGNDLAIDDIFVKQTLCDLDGDGVADIFDLDNDNDGIPNVVELGLIDDNFDATVYNDSTNPWSDTNQNGVHDAYENVNPIDSDGDGVPNYLDLDSDNDGVFDSVEYDGLGDIDVNGDGAGDGRDYIDASTDTIDNNQDGDGILHLLDNNTGHHGTSSYSIPLDSDGDGIPDYLDLFSNDASNNISNGSDISNTIYWYLDDNNDGLLDGSTDTDADGILDSFDTNSTVFGSPRDIENGSLSLSFDGRNDYIEEASNVVEGLTKVTQMAWVKIDQDFSSTGAIMGQRNFRVFVNASRKVRLKMFSNAQIQVPSSAKLEYNKWTHVTAVYDGEASEERLKIYINGEKVASGNNASGSIPVSAEDTYRIGRKPFDSGQQQYFKGEIDEVRVFNTSLSEDEIQKIVYQELDESQNFNRGKIIPKDISANNIGNNLIRYYRMDTFKDDILDNKVTPSIDVNSGAVIYNIKNLCNQSAPLPYSTIQNGDWTSVDTWTHGDVWDITDLNSVKDWSIVEIDNEINLSASYTSSGLIINENGILNVEEDNVINNTWLLSLKGVLDLKGDSQLLQSIKSDLVTSSNGKIKRRQEGASSAYWYNYWSSPVGSMSATAYSDNNLETNNSNNSGFKLNMLKKGDGSSFQFTNSYNQTGKISRYWLYTYINGVTYYDWQSFNENDTIGVGIGYTQKGTGVADSEQQYIFEGKPNNGTIVIPVVDSGGDGSVPAVSKTDYLLGNPYPSALDIHRFINDNEGVIDGTLQLWQQWSGSSHILNDYNGGYAQVNKLGAVRAYQFVGVEGDSNGNQDGTKTPSRYLPVSQGFIVEIVADGNVVFNNNQRVFVKESDADGSYNSGSVFFRGNPNSSEAIAKTTVNSNEALMQKMRLEFNSVDGPQTRRELLLGFSSDTSDDYDYGYDAKNAGFNDSDLATVLDGELMAIQAFAEVTVDKVVPLVLRSSGDHNYTIKLTELENFDEDQEIYLRDNLTNEYYDLRNDQPYEFYTQNGEYNNRLEIVFQNPSNTLSQIDEELQSLKLYYSSGRERLVVLNPNSEQLKGINVIDVSGKIVHSFSDITSQSYNEFNLPNLSTGVYVVQLITENNLNLSKKIIIN